eukprot:1176586-Prorocentrum_minimum.AAC.3
MEVRRLRLRETARVWVQLVVVVSCVSCRAGDVTHMLCLTGKEANEPLPKYNEETGQLERVSKPAPAKKAGGFELNLPAVQKKSD